MATKGFQRLKAIFQCPDTAPQALCRDATAEGPYTDSSRGHAPLRLSPFRVALGTHLL